MAKTGNGALSGIVAVIVIACGLAVSPDVAANQSGTASSGLSSDFYEDALARFDQGDYRGAIIQLKNALQQEPGNRAARILIGKAYVEVGEGATAEKELNVALSSGGDESNVIVPLGQSLLMQHKYESLLEKLQPGTRATAIEAGIRMMRGRAYVALRDLDAAENEYGEAKALEPENVNALLGLAEVAIYRGNLIRAERYIAEAVRLAPENSAAWSLDGDLKRSLGDLSGAVASYDKAIAIQPVQIEPRRNRAAVLISLDRTAEAQVDVDYLLDLLPDDPRSIYLNALIMGKSSQSEAAAAELRRADLVIRSYDVNFVRKHLPTLLIAGVVNFALGESDVALSYLGQYLQREPRHVGVRRMMATIYTRRGDDEGAARVLRPISGPGTRDPQLLAQFGTALMHSGKHAEASAVFERAISLAPDLEQLHTGRALNEMAVGNGDEAIAGLQSALDRQVDNVGHAVLLGLMHLQRHDYDKALAVAQQIQARHPGNPIGPNLAGAAIWGKGEEDAARERFEAAVGLDNDYAPAHVNLAKLDIRGGDLESAEIRLVSLVDRGLGGNEPLRALASIAERRGELAAAIAWLERVREAPEDGIETQVQLIDLQIRTGQHQKALRAARSLEAAFPDSLSVVRAVGRAAVATGDMDMAILKFRRMAELAWKSPTALHRIAELQQKAGDHKGAYTTLWRAVSIEPSYLPAQVSIVRYDAEQGEFGRALARADEVRRMFPDLATGDILAGDVLMGARRYPEAVTAYERALAKQEDSALLLRLYLARREVGDDDVLIEMLQTWLARHPSDTMVKRTLAGELARQGDLEQAVTLNEDLLRDRPDDPVVLNNLAWLYQETGRPNARSMAERAYAHAPAEPRTIDTLGWILVQEGEIREGLRLLRDAQARAAGDAGINFHVAVALSKLGRTQDARAQLEAVLNDGPDTAIAAEAEALLEQLSGS